jgi:hypothetical protein
MLCLITDTSTVVNFILQHTFSISTYIMAASFTQTITSLAEMSGGGAIPNALSNQYQLWHCLISTGLYPDPDIPHLDDVIYHDFKVEATFFERQKYRYPTSGSLALITGKFFVTRGTSTPELRVRAEPIRVYVHIRYVLIY